jgi:hypothetical protein
MHTLETDWWLLDLPEEWEAEQEDETVVIEDEDGVGVIEITTLETAEPVARGELPALARELLGDHGRGRESELAGLHGLYFEHIDGDDAVREWLLDGGDLLLLISYSCDRENAGMDDGIVDEILSTLELKPRQAK